MRRVRSAPSRASIGGCQANAVHTAQNVTKVAAATMTVKSLLGVGKVHGCFKP